MKTIFTLSNRKTFLLSLIIVLISFSVIAQTKHLVEVKSNVFTPDELKINVGDTVVWQNIQGTHNVNGTSASYPNNPGAFGNSVGSNWVYTFIFTKEGKYDYQCDPHVNFGMTGKIEVESVDNKKMLTVNFMNMDPHVNQTLTLFLKRKDTGEIITTVSKTITSQFSAELSGLEIDHSYHIDFYADHNGNGTYDAPPVDHAWRLVLDNVKGDTVVDFTHNTNFTDIDITTALFSIIENDFNFSVYPNPSNDFINFSTDIKETSKLSVKIYSLGGKVIKHWYIQDQPGSSQLDISDLHGGLYLIELETEHKIGIQKFLKL